MYSSPLLSFCLLGVLQPSNHAPSKNPARKSSYNRYQVSNKTPSATESANDPLPDLQLELKDDDRRPANFPNR